MNKKRYTGTTSRGIRCPILREGDPLEDIVVNSVLDAADNENFRIKDRDVIAVTESIVARTQGNYCTVDDIAADIKYKIGENKEICVMYPILSRNRFSILLKGIARAAKKVILVLSYPSDEVGNALLSYDQLDDSRVDPTTDTLDLTHYRKLFGANKHEFTGIDYVQYYQDLVLAEGAECEIFFSNRTRYFGSMGYNSYIAADIHTRERTKKLLRMGGADLVLGLDDIMTSSYHGSGYNAKYGLLGSNKSTDERVKLFPRDAELFVKKVQEKIKDRTGKHVEVMVYGDGAFKDPQGKIWELADPVVSPFFTEGLKGTPNELKLKYLADNDLSALSGEVLEEETKKRIKNKKSNLVGTMETQGTTPRQLTDLLGSLADLTSGSGDKGTPIILIQGYFDNYSDED